MQQEEEQYSCLEEFFVDSCRFGDFDDAVGCFEDNVDITWIDFNQNNCIHMVSANGHINILKEIIKYAIEKKIDLPKLLNHQNNYGCTPLHWATINNQIQIIQVLLENGADITIKNQNNLTCLDEAVQLNKTEILEFLQKYVSMTEDQQQSFQEAPESEEKDDEEEVE